MFRAVIDMIDNGCCSWDSGLLAEGFDLSHRSLSLDQNRHWASRPSVCHRFNELSASINLCLRVKTLADAEEFLDGLICFSYRALLEWHFFAMIILPVEIYC